MPIEVTWDLITNPSLEINLSSARYVRQAMLEGIDVGGSPKLEALYLADAALRADLLAQNAGAGTYMPGHANYLLWRIFYRPVSDTAVIADVSFEIPEIAGGPPSSWLIRDGSYLTSYSTNRMPGTHEPIVCDWNNPHAVSGFSGGDPHNSIKGERVTFGIWRPMRTIELVGLQYGQPPEGQDLTHHVNVNPWPTSAYAPPTGWGLPPSNATKPKGYWLATKFETALAKYNGYYTIEAAAMTKIIEDWSDTGTVFNRQTGRYVDVDPADITALMAPPYDYAISRGNGIVRVGFYPLADFTTAFGF